MENQRRKPERQRGEMDTDRCSRSRSVATMPWASPRGCCRCRWPLARTVTRQSGCFGCCCCYRCCYRFLRCQLVMQPTNQKTSYCQPPNSFLPVASGRFSPYRHSSIVALSRFSKSFFSCFDSIFWRKIFSRLFHDDGGYSRVLNSKRKIISKEIFLFSWIERLVSRWWEWKSWLIFY